MFQVLFHYCLESFIGKTINVDSYNKDDLIEKLSQISEIKEKILDCIS
jgi:hypothetical protein